MDKISESSDASSVGRASAWGDDQNIFKETKHVVEFEGRENYILSVVGNVSFDMLIIIRYSIDLIKKILVLCKFQS